MVEEVSDQSSVVHPTTVTTGGSTTATDTTVVETKPTQVSGQEEESKSKTGELLCFGGVGGKNAGGLQKHFERFRKAKIEEVQYRNYMAASAK